MIKSTGHSHPQSAQGFPMRTMIPASLIPESHTKSMIRCSRKLHRLRRFLLSHTLFPMPTSLLFSAINIGVPVSLTLVLSCSASSTLNIVPAGETVKCYVRRVEFIVTPARLHFAFETSSIYEALHIDTMTLFLEIVGLAMGF